MQSEEREWGRPARKAKNHVAFVNSQRLEKRDPGRTQRKPWEEAVTFLENFLFPVFLSLRPMP